MVQDSPAVAFIAKPQGKSNVVPAMSTIAFRFIDIVRPGRAGFCPGQTAPSPTEASQVSLTDSWSSRSGTHPTCLRPRLSSSLRFSTMCFALGRARGGWESSRLPMVGRAALEGRGSVNAVVCSLNTLQGLLFFGHQRTREPPTHPVTHSSSRTIARHRHAGGDDGRVDVRLRSSGALKFTTGTAPYEKTGTRAVGDPEGSEHSLTTQSLISNGQRVSPTTEESTPRTIARDGLNSVTSNWSLSEGRWTVVDHLEPPQAMVRTTLRATSTLAKARSIMSGSTSVTRSWLIMGTTSPSTTARSTSEGLEAEGLSEETRMHEFP